MKQTPQMVLERRLWRNFNKGITQYHLLDEGDHVLIGLSGGKDSLALLELMARRAQVYKPRIRLSAIHVRMENISYESDTTYLEHFASQYDIPLLIRTTRFEIHPDNRKTPCFLCSWNRRKMLFETAQELGCNKIALGHHQDDILHTTLLNLTFQGMFGTMPVRLRMRKFPMTIIRPLCLLQEKDLAQWAQLQQYHKQIKLCPHETHTHRDSMRTLMGQMEQLSPEARFSIWNALEREGKLIEEPLP